MDLKAIQTALRERKMDAWLFYDHHHRDPIAYSVLGLAANLHVTRRWYYVIPAEGDPGKLMHRIEPGHLDSLPGKKEFYSAWQEQHENLRTMLAPYKRIAMQYSPNNMVPYIGLVDGGTIELVRSFGKEIVSSGDLVAIFEAAWSEKQIESHFAAGKAIDAICEAAFKEVRRLVNSGKANEFAVQQFIMEGFAREGLVTDDPPIVGVNANSGNPHYSPTPQTSKPINEGDFVLLDMWAKKKDQPDSVFYDITWVGTVGPPTDEHRKVFQIVRDARDVGFNTVKKTIE
jgi:Xaa-Pro dipeptidase